LLKTFLDLQIATESVGLSKGKDSTALLSFISNAPPEPFRNGAKGAATDAEIALLKSWIGEVGGGFASRFQKIKQFKNIDTESGGTPSSSQAELLRLKALKENQLKRRAGLELDLRSAQAASDKPNSTFDVNGTNRKWSFKSEDGVTKQVETPLQPEPASSRYGPNSTSKEVGEPAVKLKVVGADGDVHEVTIPSHWKVRTAVPDSVDGYAPKDASGAGLIFWDPKGHPGPNGTTIFNEIRVSPPTSRDHVHANYSNGYVRQSQVHIKNASVPGKGEVVQRVHLDMSGKPFLGLDGKRFGIDPSDPKQSTDAFRIIHNGRMFGSAAEINMAPPKGLGAGTISDSEVTRLQTELDALKAAQREMQVQTHGYLAPNGYKPRPK
jgi:hypothetical protein